MSDDLNLYRAFHAFGAHARSTPGKVWKKEDLAGLPRKTPKNVNSASARKSDPGL